MKKRSTQGRRHLPDIIRGVTLISMIAYHTLWDLTNLYGIRLSWYHTEKGFLWQQSICCTFILLSGYCVRLGTQTLRRGVIVFCAGLLVTGVTLTALPGAAVRFGVLTLLGSAMILTDFIRPVLLKLPAAAGLALSLLLFYITRWTMSGTLQFYFRSFRLPGFLYRNQFSAYLGFPPPDFFSTDYFPLIPWVFLFFAGFYWYDIGRRLPGFLKTITGAVRIPPLEAVGKHSLLIYLAHQPVIYGVLTILQRAGLL